MVDLGHPATIEIAPINHATEFRFRLRSSGTRVAAEFVVSANDLAKLTQALQALLARQTPRRTPGKPSLRIVTDESSS